MNHNHGDIIEYTCKYCNCNTAKIWITKNTKIFEAAICTNCGKILYAKDLGDNPDAKPQPKSVQCPYCKSFQTKKISNASKVGSAALFGVFALGKISKQWHCNHCNSDF